MISFKDPIPFYDFKMTAKVKRRLSGQVVSSLVSIRREKGLPGRVMYIGPASPYGQMLQNLDRFFGDSIVCMNIARIGVQCRQLIDWLDLCWGEMEVCV
jgi:hypothetical protein